MAYLYKRFIVFLFSQKNTRAMVSQKPGFLQHIETPLEDASFFPECVAKLIANSNLQKFLS
jgi:hypothetical protein